MVEGGVKSRSCLTQLGEYEGNPLIDYNRKSPYFETNGSHSSKSSRSGGRSRHMYLGNFLSARPR